MADEIQDFDTVTIPELDNLTIALTSYFATSNLNGKLGKATVAELVSFIAPFVQGVASSGFIATTGTVLPVATAGRFTFVGGPATFTQTTGGNIVTTQLLNLLAANGTSWSLILPIPIVVPDSKTVNWTAKAYASDSVVYYLGKYWRSNAAIISTDIPGISTKWLEELFAYHTNDSEYNTTALINLIPNSNKGLGLTKINGTLLEDGLPNTSNSNGSPVASIIRNYKGFSTALKFSLATTDRVTFNSGVINLTSALSDASLKVNSGIFLDVPTAFTGSITFGIKEYNLGTSYQSTFTEFVQLSNNIRYYRLSQGVLANAASKKINLYCIIDNRTGSGPVDIYLAAPAIVRTNDRLTPAVYHGIEYDLPSVVNANNNSLLNLFPNANVGFSGVKIKGTPHVDDGLPTLVFQSGTPVASVIKDYAGFPNALKMTLKSGDRCLFYSAPIDLTKVIVDSTVKVNCGFYANVPLNYTGQLQFFFRDVPTSAQTIDQTNDVEFVQLGNGWRYYRLKQGRLLPNPGYTSIELYCNFNNTGTDTVDLYFASPTIARADGALIPGIYNGIDNVPKASSLAYSDLLELNNNPVFDSVFDKELTGGQVLSPWLMATGNPSVVFPSAHRVVNIDTPIGNTAVEIDVTRRSSDNFYSDNQLYQTLLIPERLRNKPLFSFGFYFKRESAIPSVAIIVNFFSDEAGTVAIGTTVSKAADFTSEIVNQFTFAKFENLVMPVGAKSVKIVARTQWPSGNTTTGTIVKVHLTGFVLNFISGTLLGYTRSPSTDTVGVKLRGKIWTSYGDSITALNLYQTPVWNKYGLTHKLRAVGGSTVQESGQTAYFLPDGTYVARFPEAQPAGTTEYKSSMSNQERINTIPLDTQIITILAGANDYPFDTPSQSVSLGAITDETSTTTFYGAYQLMLNRIYARIPDAEFILITMTHRRGEDTIRTVENKSFEDYRQAVRNIGLKYKYRVIEMDKSGINKLNEAKYLTDLVHPNSAGCERMSRLLLQEFPDIY